MFLLKRFHKVYVKLIISFVVVVFLCTAMVGIICYFYFSDVLSTEILATNEEMVSRLGESLDRRVFGRTESLWLHYVANEPRIQQLFEQPERITSIDYYNIAQYLQRDVSANNDLVMNVEIYVKELGVLLTSVPSIKYLSEEDQIPYADIMRENTVVSEWFPSNDPPDIEISGFNSGKYITFIRTIPYVRNANVSLKGYIAIKIKADAIMELFEYDEMLNSRMYVVNNREEIVIQSGNGSPKRGYLDRLKSSGNRFFLSRDGDTVVSVLCLNFNQLYLIRETKVDVFYRKRFMLQWPLMLICLVFALLGFALSRYFVIGIYNPIKNIVLNIKKYMIDVPKDVQPLSGQEHNEYRIIDTAINSLHKTVVDMKTTIDENLILIQRDTVYNLLRGGMNGQMAESAIQNACLDFHRECYYAAVITIGRQYKGLIEKDQIDVMKYDILGKLRNFCGEKAFVYGINISLYEIDVVVNCDADYRIAEVFDYISRYCKQNHGILPLVGIGNSYKSADKLHESYKDALSCIKYRLFYPEQSLFLAEHILYRELSVTEFSSKNLQQFSKTLHTGEIAQIREMIDILIQEIVGTECSYAQAFRRIQEIYSVFWSFTIENNTTSDYVFSENAQKFDDIYQFGEWLSELTELFVKKQDMKSSVTASEMMEYAKRIIEENIDKDLSLDIVADRLFITPAYLSTMFKNEIGINFNAYIVERRLELARELVLNTNYSINQITKNVGFNSSTYLIKRFRERFGDTPINYKRRYLLEKADGEAGKAQI